jgi:hypothetical protein
MDVDESGDVGRMRRGGKKKEPTRVIKKKRNKSC